MKGLECQVDMCRLHLEGSGEPREDSEPGKELVRYRFQGAHSGSQDMGAEASVQPSTHRDGFPLLGIQAQKDMAHGPYGLPRPQRLRGG